MSSAIRKDQQLSRKITQNQTSTSAKEYDQVSTKINTYQHISTNINKYQQISTNVNKDQHISTGTENHQTPILCVHAFLVKSKEDTCVTIILESSIEAMQVYTESIDTIQKTATTIQVYVKSNELWRSCLVWPVIGSKV